MKIKKIIVVGSDTLIGNSLKRLVFLKEYDNLDIKKNYTWIFLKKNQINLLNYNEVFDYFNSTNVNNTIIINLATYLENFDLDSENQLSIYENNLKIDTNLISVCVNLRIEKFINILPIDIKNIKKYEKLNKNNLKLIFYRNYLYSRYNSITYFDIINQCSSKYQYINLLIPNIFGEYDDYLSENLQLVPYLIKTIEKIQKNNDLNLNVNPDKEINVVYVDNISDIIIDFITSFTSSGEYIVSSDNYVTISKIIDIVSKIINKKNELYYKYNYDTSENYQTNIIDNDLSINNTLDDLYKKKFQFKYSLEEGLEVTILWYLKNRHILHLN